LLASWKWSSVYPPRMINQGLNISAKNNRLLIVFSKGGFDINNVGDCLSVNSFSGHGFCSLVEHLAQGGMGVDVMSDLNRCELVGLS